MQVHPVLKVVLAQGALKQTQRQALYRNPSNPISEIDQMPSAQVVGSATLPYVRDGLRRSQEATPITDLSQPCRGPAARRQLPRTTKTTANA